MRAIAEPFFDANPAMLGPLFGLLLFVAFFAAVVVVALRAPAPQLDHAASLPFQNDESPEGMRTAHEPTSEEPV